jgi:hypothetical protein
MHPRVAPLVLCVALAGSTIACAKPFLPVRDDVTAIAPAPAGIEHTTWTFTGDGGLTLFAQAWRPSEAEPRGVLIIMHGLRDHSSRYAEVAARATERGYAV